MTCSLGQKIVALIETTAPVCVEKFGEYPQLGRFTLRDEGRTIAIGKVGSFLSAFIREVLIPPARLRNSSKVLWRKSPIVSGTFLFMLLQLLLLLLLLPNYHLYRDVY